MKNLLLRNKGLTAGIAVLLIAVLVWLAFGFFGIHKAFVDDVVDEDGPVFDVVASAPEASEATPIPQTAPVEAPAAPEAEVAVAVEPETVPAGDAAEAPEAGPEPTPVPAQAADDASEPEATAVDTAAPETVAATPAPTPVPEPTPEPQAAPGEIVTQFSGSFQSLNSYSVSGTASVLSNGTEQRFLRLENFASDNGPDLKVYLRAADGEFVSLGNLSGNIGNQNYEIPVGVDLSVFSSVEIWCERFSRGFGAAQLN